MLRRLLCDWEGDFVSWALGLVFGAGGKTYTYFKGFGLPDVFVICMYLHLSWEAIVGWGLDRGCVLLSLDAYHTL